jgi:hypothetical protein
MVKQHPTKPKWLIADCISCGAYIERPRSWVRGENIQCGACRRNVVKVEVACWKCGKIVQRAKRYIDERKRGMIGCSQEHAAAGRAYPPVMERIDSQVAQGRPSECWPWQGYLEGSPRYKRPNFMANGKRINIQRLIYERANGGIDPARLVLLSCGLAICCNPDHLYQVGD